MFNACTSKPFRVLTGWLVGCQVFEVDAFDDFHREASGGGVVHQAHKDLWRGSLADRLEWRGALAACHVWEANLGFTTLKVLAENCWEFNNLSSSDEIFIVIVTLCDCHSTQSFYQLLRDPENKLLTFRGYLLIKLTVTSPACC